MELSIVTIMLLTNAGGILGLFPSIFTMARKQMRIAKKATSAIILKKRYESSSDLSGRSLLGDGSSVPVVRRVY